MNALKKIAATRASATYPGGLVEALTASATSGRSVTLTKTGQAWMSALGVPSPWIGAIRK